MAIRALWYLALAVDKRTPLLPAGREALPSAPGIRYLLTYASSAELAAAFGEQQTAGQVHRSLLPYADLFVCSSSGIAIGASACLIGAVIFAAFGPGPHDERPLRRRLACRTAALLVRRPVEGGTELEAEHEVCVVQNRRAWLVVA